MNRRILSVLVPIIFLSYGWVSAQEAEKKPSEATPPKPLREAREVLKTTRHSLELEGGRLDYQATAGTLLLKSEDGQVKAEVFFIAYTREGVSDPATRPLTFSFNGGPGSSSVWLHLGALGPRRVALSEEGWPLPPPPRLVDNQETWLDMTDLVFIDPVSTGFSRAAPGEDAKEFHGLKEDIESVAEFIRLYVGRFDRWSSPKFLTGESYGTTRAAGLSRYLQDRFGMYLNGLVLVSSILNFQTVDFHVGNDLPYILHLPTYTATAWYHKKLSGRLQRGSLEQALAQAEAFALGDYATALMQGDRLPASRRAEIAREFSRLTGISADFIRRSDLRLPLGRFTKELLRDQDRTVGRLDSRFKGIDRDSAGERFEYDPSMAAIMGPYSATLKDYLRRDLDFQSELPYEILTSRVRPWNFGGFNNSYVDVSDDLRQAFVRNRNLRVFVANGYYDFATPYFATRYTFSHMGIPADLKKNISMGYYEAGHMMYIHHASLRALKRDIKKFYAQALRQP